MKIVGSFKDTCSLITGAIHIMKTKTKEQKSEFLSMFLLTSKGLILMEQKQRAEDKDKER